MAAACRHALIALIERFGAALISLRDRILRRTKEEAGVRAEIHEIAREAGLDINVARSLEPESLLLWLAPTGEPDPAKLWLMAELLYLEGLRRRSEDAAHWRGDLERARALLERLPGVWRPGEAFVTAEDRVTEIGALLEQ